MQRAGLRAARALQRCLRGDPEGGFAEWAETVAEAPSVAHTYLVRARWLMATDTAAAMEDYDRAVTAEPCNAVGYWRRADCHAVLGDQDRALANYRRAVALDPSLFDAFHSIAKIAAARDQHADAVQAYDRAIQLAPRYVDFYLGRAHALEQLGDLAAAVRDYARVLELDPTRTDVRFYRVLNWQRLGHPDLAIREMAHLAEVEPGDHHNHRILGKLRLEARQYALAVESLTRAIELSPDEPMALAHRGQAYFEQGEHERAFADLERAIALKEDEPELFLAHAKACASQGKLDLAIASTSRAIALAPGHAMAHLMRSIYRDHATEDDAEHEAVLADLNRAVELAPHHAGYLRQRGEHLLSHGAFAAAIADFDRALAIAPQAAALYYGRGVARSRLIDELMDQDEDYWEEEEDTRTRCLAAVSDLERAIELGLDDPDVYGELWSAWGQMQGEEVARRAVIERAILAVPGHAIFYRYRSQERTELGDAEGAEADRLRAKELGFVVMGED